MNKVFIIHPYKTSNDSDVWVFDDESLKLKQEPFVSIANRAIDLAVRRASIKNADKGFNLYFSSKPLPINHIELTLVSREFNWSYYRLQGTDMIAPLCPVLLLFFSAAPKKLYAFAEASINRGSLH